MIGKGIVTVCTGGRRGGRQFVGGIRLLRGGSGDQRRRRSVMLTNWGEGCQEKPKGTPSDLYRATPLFTPQIGKVVRL